MTSPAAELEGRLTEARSYLSRIWNALYDHRGDVPPLQFSESEVNDLLTWTERARRALDGALGSDYQPEHTRPDTAQADQPAADEAYTPDPQIEAVPLPNGRFLLVLSAWPAELTELQAAQLRENTGAAHILLTPFPVWTPDGVRSGANGAAVFAAGLRPSTAAERLAAVTAYLQTQTPPLQEYELRVGDTVKEGAR